jgi:hypothetical protein
MLILLATITHLLDTTHLHLLLSIMVINLPPIVIDSTTITLILLAIITNLLVTTHLHLLSIMVINLPPIVIDCMITRL